MTQQLFGIEIEAINRNSGIICRAVDSSDPSDWDDEDDEYWGDGLCVPGDCEACDETRAIHAPREKEEKNEPKPVLWTDALSKSLNTEGWVMGRDSSINSHSSKFWIGYELKSPPLEVNNKNLRLVSNLVDELKAKTRGFVNTTCGLHVHLSAAGMTSEHKLRVARRYANFEGQFDKFMHQSRRENNNTYCRSLKGILSYQRYPTIESFNNHYLKVNLGNCVYERMSKYTIEFRHHHGSLDGERIANWVKLLQDFKYASQEEIRNDEWYKRCDAKVCDYILSSKVPRLVEGE
jgi:hypothetical protein